MAQRIAPADAHGRQVEHSLADLGGMCAVMCVGGSILSFASFEAASSLRYPNLVQQAPELSAASIMT